MRRALSIITSLSVVGLSAMANNANLPKLGNPLDIPLVLSANFGEIRPDHFHSGVDFKTQGTIGHKVMSVADGYVSRASVSPWGYGRAVYVKHPKLGLTSVYGHLESFAPAIDSLVRRHQYAERNFSVDIEFAPGQLPVRLGDLIAYSGNAGHSFGPHLHFDIRDITSQIAYDPLEYYKDQITDHHAPEIVAITLYPQGGVVAGGQHPVSLSAPWPRQMVINAWGTVVPAIEAIDRMTNTSNKYGIKRLTLKVDGKEVYRRVINSVNLSHSRDVNSLVHYPTLMLGERLDMVTSVPAARPVGDMIVGDGTLTIDQERDYLCEFIAEDNHGNRSNAAFTIRGVQSVIPAINHLGSLIRWNQGTLLNAGDIKIGIPRRTLYDDTYITLKALPAGEYYSPIHQVGNQPVALANSVSLDIAVTDDTHHRKRQYCIVRINEKGEPVYCGGKYDNGRVKTEVRRLGRYAVAVDSIPPTVEVINGRHWNSTDFITLKIDDNLSGIESFSGEIDGQWVCMELDGKTATLSYRIDREKFPKGKEHALKLILTDGIGNRRTSTFRF